MRTITLEGWLADAYGESFRVDAASPGAALRLLCANFPDFKQRVGTEDQEFAVLVVGGNEKGLTHQQINNPIPEEAEIRIVPVIAGSKGAGVFQTILGVVLIVVGVILSFVPGGQGFSAPMIKIGIVMMLAGVASMLIGTPTPPKAAETDKNTDNIASDLFNGAVNTSAQGNPAPLCYGGPIVVGSYVVSAGYSTVQVPV